MMNPFSFFVGWILWRFWRSCECRVGWKMHKPNFQVSMWQGLWGSHISQQLLLQVGLDDRLYLVPLNLGITFVLFFYSLVIFLLFSYVESIYSCMSLTCVVNKFLHGNEWYASFLCESMNFLWQYEWYKSQMW